MNCKHVEKMMDDYMSGQIEPLVKEMIDRHLQDCETCRGNFLKARSVSDFLRQAEPSGPENSISGDLLNRLRDIDRENTDASVPPAGQRISRRIKWLTIAAVAAALVAVGLLIIPFPSHIDQQHISPRSGPGYTWMGDYPPSNPDPFSLEHLRPPVSPDETIRDGEQPGRITHTLDFELDSSHSSENGMNGKETERR